MKHKHAPAERRSEVRARSHRRWLINPRFQLLFMGAMSFLALISIGSAFVITRYYLHKFERVAIEMGLSIDHALFGLLKELRGEMTWIFGLFAIAIVLILGGGGMILSHLIAGPIYRLESHMKRVAEEQNSPHFAQATHEISFRKSDFFPELARAYNRVLTLLRKKQ